tara:strand:- start:242 stop:538 length:297 start_codon:yes stop_codon:yes gene_type:complete
MQSNKTDNFKFIGVALAILVQAAGIVWWASKLEGEVRHNDFQIQIMAKDVEKTVEFVELWPAGKWGSGSLPSDVKQDLKIERLEIQVDKLNNKLYNGG